MHEILQHLPGRLDMGIIVVDRLQKILLFNEWLERYTGKGADEVQGLSLPELYPLFQRQLYQSIFEQTLKHGKSMFCSAALHPVFIPPRSGENACRQNMQIEPLRAGGEPHILLQIFDITNQYKRVQLLKQQIARRTGAEQALNYQLKIEKIISEISTAFVTLPAERLDEGINYTLKIAGEFFQVDRSYLFRFSDDGEKMINTHEWCAEGIEAQAATIRDLPVSSMPWWARQIKNNDYVYIPDVAALPDAAKTERAEFQRQGIQSLLYNGSLVGDDDITFLILQVYWQRDKTDTLG